MKNIAIAIVGNYPCSYDIFSRLKEYDNSINIFEITPTTAAVLHFSDVVILNEYSKKIDLDYISPSSCVIINSDYFINNAPCVLTASRLITTGYSAKSTLTVSSVDVSGTDKILCCLQRSLHREECGEQEEFIVETKVENVSILLTAVATALCLNIDKDMIQKIFK